MKTFHTFKDAENFQKFLRSEKYPDCHVKSGGCLDCVRIAGIVYTMHEYDMGGQSVTWGNLKNMTMIEIRTKDRYQMGYEDAEVYAYPASFLRNDISYAE